VNKQRVLFLCTHNSARSQMAEGLLRSMADDRFEVASAGTEATVVHPLAVRAMADVGIDVSRHTSKTVDALLDQAWDHVITVCDSANERCPVFPKKTHRLHWSFPDPSQATGGSEDRLNVFRRVRDAIRARLTEWLEAPTVVRLAEKFGKFSDAWSPKVVGEVNGMHVKLVKLRGEFVWHHHEREDELFLVVQGRLRMQLRDGGQDLGPGELMIVPRGIEHCPRALTDEVHVLLLEPAGTLNTGNVRNERTVAELERI
jgi:arsenate reductase (thioredoxin)